MKRNATHLIVTAKPVISSEAVEGVVVSLRDIEEAQKLVYNINTRALKYTFDDIMGESEALRRANQALITSRGNSTVLISGESGTGKKWFT